jgi:hypothetical protein
MRRIDNGLCATKVQALLIGVPLQDVYKPFCIKLLSQQAHNRMKNMQMVVIISGI